MICTSEYNSLFERELGILSEKIIKYNMLLSGSSISSIILGLNFHEDYDIYVTNNYPIITQESEFERWIVETVGGVLTFDGSAKDINTKSYKYIIKNGKSINIIFTDKNSLNDIRDYITITSDLDICASTYDGFTVCFPNNLLEMKINCINNITFKSENLKTKKEKINSNKVKFKRNLRILKYMRRGFEIYPSLIVNNKLEKNLLNEKNKNIDLENKLDIISEMRYHDVQNTFFLNLKNPYLPLTSNLKIYNLENLITRVYPGMGNLNELKWIDGWNFRKNIL